MVGRQTWYLVPVLLGWLVAACGSEFSFFFVSNPGAFDDVETQGGIIIEVRDPNDADHIESVTIIQGTLPLGMELFPDGTLRGIPEESGFFSFTAEWRFADGHSERQRIELELNDATD